MIVRSFDGCSILGGTGAALFLAVATVGCFHDVKSTTQCPSITGLDAVVTPGTLVLFGEIHGTNEVPVFVGDAACALARKTRVHVGFELPAADRKSLEIFLAGTGADGLRESEFWGGSYHDGRSSAAVLALLERLRDYRHRGAQIEVFFFDDPERLTLQRRDEAMAENISRERGRAPADVYLIEVGNFHARTAIGAPWDPSKQWMGTFLASHEPHLVALDMRSLPGTSWVCVQEKPDAPQVCGSRTIKGILNTSAKSAEPSVKLEPELEGGYSGTFSVGALTASPPAFPR